MTADFRRLLARLLSGRLSRNGLFALVQGIFVTACVFLVYRLVILHVGLDRFGVWSLLIACATVARLLDVSGGGALARFVAAASLGERGSFGARNYVHTVVTTSLVFNLALGLILWLAAPLALPLFIQTTYLSEARSLAPWAIAVSVLGALAYAPISAIDGAQRADLRSLVAMTAALVFLILSFILVPRLGVAGFAAAQLAQQAVMLMLGWVVLRGHVAGLGWLPRYWRREVFAETTGYALRLNAVGVMGLLFEPLAKFAFNHGGGPGLVALFELAMRLVTQIRSLVVTAAAPLSPAFAAQSDPRTPAFRNLLEKSLKIAALASIGIAFSALAAAPVVSLVVFDRLSPELLGMNAALTAGWATNTLALPLYFAAQGLGELRWIFTSQAVIAASIPAGVLLIVPTFGTTGLVFAIVIGLMGSSLILLLGNARILHADIIIYKLWRQLLGAGAIILLLCLAAELAVVLARV